MPIISLEIRINSCTRGNFASRSPATLRRIWELIVTRPKLRRRPEGARQLFAVAMATERRLLLSCTTSCHLRRANVLSCFCPRRRRRRGQMIFADQLLQRSLGAARENPFFRSAALKIDAAQLRDCCTHTHTFTLGTKAFRKWIFLFTTRRNAGNTTRLM
jgi:hypothetical protein